MSKQKDIRWQQRHINYAKALAQLKRFIDKGELSDLEAQGLIKAFEYTYELAWKTLGDLLNDLGFEDIIGPRPIIEESFNQGIIHHGKSWLDMIKSRNLTSHTYNTETADQIVKEVVAVYYPLFCQLDISLNKLKAS